MLFLRDSSRNNSMMKDHFAKYYYYCFYYYLILWNLWDEGIIRWCHNHNHVKTISINPTCYAAAFSIAPDSHDRHQQVNILSRHDNHPRRLLLSNAESVRSRYSDRLFMSSQLSSSDSGSRSATNPVIDQMERILKEKYPSFYSLLRSSASSKGGDFLVPTMLSDGNMTLFVPNEEAFIQLGKKRCQQLKDPRNDEIVRKICDYHVIPDDALNPSQLWIEDWTAKATTATNAGNKVKAKRPIKYSGIRTAGGVVPIERRSRHEVLMMKQQQQEQQRDSTGNSIWNDMIWSPIKTLFTNDQDSDTDLGKNDDDIMTIGPFAKIVRSWKLSTTTGSNSNTTSTVSGTTTTVIIHETDSLISPELLWRYCDQLTIL